MIFQSFCTDINSITTRYSLGRLSVTPLFHSSFFLWRSLFALQRYCVWFILQTTSYFLKNLHTCKYSGSIFLNENMRCLCISYAPIRSCTAM